MMIPVLVIISLSRLERSGQSNKKVTKMFEKQECVKVAEKDEFVDIHMVFIHYNRELNAHQKHIKLEEVRMIDASSFETNYLETRYPNTPKGKFLCARFDWYIRTMRNYLKLFPEKKLRVMHWGMISGNTKTFVFKRKIFPDVAYTFDSKRERWFCARVEKATSRILFEFRTRELKEPPPIMEILDKFQVKPTKLKDEAQQTIEEPQNSRLPTIIEKPFEERFAQELDDSYSHNRDSLVLQTDTPKLRRKSASGRSILPDLIMVHTEPVYAVPCKIKKLKLEKENAPELEDLEVAEDASISLNIHNGSFQLQKSLSVGCRSSANFSGFVAENWTSQIEDSHIYETMDFEDGSSLNQTDEPSSHKIKKKRNFCARIYRKCLKIGKIIFRREK